MVDVRHKTVAEVRTTIRREITQERQYLASIGQGVMGVHERTKTQATIAAFEATLHWLADLE